MSTKNVAHVAKKNMVAWVYGCCTIGTLGLSSFNVVTHAPR